MVSAFLIGVIATSSIAAAGFFVKFWRKTHDTFFLWFAASFFIEGVNRTALIFFANPSEAAPWVYIVRLASMVLIIVAIWRKNQNRAG